MIDVTNPPGLYSAADPTGAIDSQPQLQEMLNGLVGTTPEERGALYFPPGRYPSAAR